MPASAADIALALLNRVATLEVPDPVAGGFVAIAMPDVAPPWGEASTPDRYLAVTLFDNRPAWEAIGPGKMDQGLLQVSIIWPRGTGTIGIKTAAQSVMNHFPKSMTLREGTASVKVSAEPWASSAIISDAETLTPVTIPWVASAV